MPHFVLVLAFTNADSTQSLDDCSQNLSPGEQTRTLLPLLSPQTHRKSLQLLRSAVSHSDQAQVLVPLYNEIVGDFCAPACRGTDFSASSSVVGEIFRSCIEEMGISSCVDVGDVSRKAAVSLGVEGGEGSDARAVIAARDIQPDVRDQITVWRIS